MDLTRRTLLSSMSAGALGFAGLQLLGGTKANAQQLIAGYGPLVPDPARLLDLPRGFSYRIVSREGEPMSDGLRTPAAFDGMAAFPVPGSRHLVALIRNHEVWARDKTGGAFGDRHELAARIPRSKIFDFAGDGAPKLGGTSTLIWDMRAQRVVRSHLSLAGTCGNCAGGLTPWGSWLSCEETTEKNAPLVSKPHGWIFEVPSRARGIVDPIPLRAMGRFKHEAAIVDPRTGILYLTEDQQDGLFYRFLPNARGQLARGGRLQALALSDGRERDLRNWPADGAPERGQGIVAQSGQRLATRWIDLDQVEAPEDDLRKRGFASGGLRFARGEGVTLARVGGETHVYFCCTTGGPKQLGQVWRYIPSRYEGQIGERAEPAMLDLFVESVDAARLQMCDNITVTPWGHLIVCEDGPDDQPQFLRGVTPSGQLYNLAANGYSEMAGTTFSPDGSTLFVNAQTPGITFAITGPWRRLNSRPQPI